MRQRMLHMFNVHNNEVEPTLLLLLYNFCGGFVIIYFETAAITMFLGHFDVENLPWVYIGSAIIISIIGMMYVYIEVLLSFKYQRLFFIVFCLCSIIIFYIALLSGITGTWLILCVVWVDVLFALVSLEANLLAARMFNVRQGKRLFALVASGSIAATVVGGFSIPLILQFVSIEHLLSLSFFWCILLLACLIFFLQRYDNQLNQTNDDENADDDENASVFELLRDPYLQLLFLVSALSTFAFFFLDYMFYDQLEINFPNENALASFLGIFFAVSGMIGFVMNSMLSGRLLNRFGMSFGLLILPLVLTLGIISAAMSYAVLAILALVFWLIIATKVLDNVVRSSIEEPTLMLLYQPMQAQRRARVQRFLETGVDPLASIAVGLLLLLLTSVYSWQTLDLAYLLLFIIAAWIFVAIMLRHKYTETLMQALTHRSFGGAAISLNDSESTAILAKRLTSHVSGEVIYCLNMLEEMQHESLENFMLKLLHSESDQVRLHVIERIGMLGMIAAMPHIRQMLQHKQSTSMTAALLQTMCAIGDVEVFEEIIPWLEHANNDIRTGVIIGMLRSGGIDGVLAAGSHLNRLLIATDADDRCTAAYILGKVGTSAFYRPLVKLMQDTHLSVRRTAITATIELHNLRLLPTLLEQLHDPQTRDLAAISIAAYGEKALDAMKNMWPQANNDLRLRMVRIFGGMRHSKAMNFLWQELLFSHINTGHTMSLIDALLQALVLCRYKVETHSQKQKQILVLMQQEIQRSMWALASKRALLSLESAATDTHIIRLCAALEREVQHCRKRIFDLLALILPCENILNAKMNYFSNFAEKRAYSIEVIDNLLHGELRQMVLVLLDDMQDDKRLLLLSFEYLGAEQGQESFDAAIMTEHECLHSILCQPAHMCLPWTISCALYMVAKHEDHQFISEVQDLLTHSNDLVRETAVWTLAGIAPFDAAKSIKHMITDASKAVALVARKVFVDLMTPTQRQKLTLLLRQATSSDHEDVK